MGDLEPWFIKLMLLLRSKSENSAEELRLLLEESIKQKYGSKKLIKPIPGPAPSVIKRGSISEELLPPPKKLRVETTPSVTSREAHHSESSSGSSGDSNELEMEIQRYDNSEDGAPNLEMLDDLACVICRAMSVGPGNRLVECAECHSLYHQECHKPQISDCDVSDPRLVWYCSNCTVNTAPSAASSSSSSSSSQVSKPSKPPSRSGQGSPVTFSSKPFGSTASSKKSSSSTSKHSSSASNKNVVPNINIIFADRRIQNMKKKAAKKQEKRITN